MYPFVSVCYLLFFKEIKSIEVQLQWSKDPDFIPTNMEYLCYHISICFYHHVNVFVNAVIQIIFN